jgi:hypothetical protein
MIKNDGGNVPEGKRIMYRTQRRGEKNYFKLRQDISDDVSFCSYVIQRRYFKYTVLKIGKLDIDCREERILTGLYKLDRILTGLYKLKTLGRKRLAAIFR